MKMLNVYDMNRRKTAVLQNAYDIKETQELNKIYSLDFSIPATDEKVQYIQPFHYVRYGEDGQLYRIIKKQANSSDASTLTVSCEHVIAILCDDLMFGSHQLGGVGTADVIRDLLSMQEETHWILGECDFDRRFEYNWEQENILNALYSIPKEFTKAYKWTFDTVSFPWKISLKAIDETVNPEYYIRAKSNLLSSGTGQDFTDICTRIYPLGYGEGVNQLNIKDVNGGQIYLQSPAAVVAQYGIKEKVLVDRRFENAESLKEYAQTMLNELQTPAMSRTFNVIDLYPLTAQNIDDAEVGKICKMTEDGTIAYITKTTRTLDKAGDLQISISTKATDVASTVADLADRVRIESVYAQGATQLYQHSKDANATSDKGMIMSLYFPQEMRQINKVLMRLRVGKFRSYSQATDLKGSFHNTYTITAAEQTTIAQTNTTSDTVEYKISEKRTTGLKNATTGKDVQPEFVSEEGEGGSTNVPTKDGEGGFAADKWNGTTGFDGGFEPTEWDGTSGLDGGVDCSTTGNDGAESCSTTGKDGAESCSTTGKDGSYSGSTGDGGGFDTSTSEGGGQSGTTSIASGGGGISLGAMTVNITIDKTDDKVSWEQSPYTYNTPVDVEVYDGGAHTHNVVAYTGEVTPPASADYKHNHAINYANGATENGYHGHSTNIVNYTTDASGNVGQPDEDAWGHHHYIAKNSLRHVHTASASGSVQVNNNEGNNQTGFSHSHDFKIDNHSHSISVSNHTHTFNTPNHMHSFTTPNHTHSFTTPNHTHTFTLPDHQHKFALPNHKHTFDLPEHKHTVNIAHQHVYDISHSHTISAPAHTHAVTIPEHSHTIDIPDHSHNVVPGIYEFGNPTGFEIYVNGVRKANISNKTSYEGDISTWLLNSDNQIDRNAWIDIEIKPKAAKAADAIAYMQCSVFVQGFVQSRGGGNY